MAILIRRDENAVAYLTMNAPERLNALSDEMLSALQETLNALKKMISESFFYSHWRVKNGGAITPKMRTDLFFALR